VNQSENQKFKNWRSSFNATEHFSVPTPTECQINT